MLCPIAAGVAYWLGWLKAERMVANGQGFEMAFYWSPLVFLAVDAILVVGVVTGLAGTILGPGHVRRSLSLSGGVICLAAFFLVPWGGQRISIFP